MIIMLRKSLFYPLFFVSILLSSCEFKCTVGESSDDKEKKSAAVEKNGAVLYNGIKLNANGLKVDKAYLLSKEDGKRIEDGNIVDVKKGVKLIVMIDGGWKEENGKVFPGASLQAVADSGEKMLDEPDLFAGYGEEGVSLEDAKVIALSVTFDKLQTDRPVSFQVSFRIWDKKSSAFAEGNYTIHSQ